MWRALALLLFLALPLAARAQTTTFVAGSACSSEMTLTNGGLTLNAPVNNAEINIYCIGNTAKYSGLWYFEFTVNTVPTSGLVTSVGVSNNGASQPVVGGTPLSTAYSTYPTAVNFASWNATNGSARVTWDNNGNFSTPVPVAGQTGALAIDLNTDPPQLWVTGNVAGTGGLGGGPEWNGSTTASPTAAGSGIPTTGGTGLGFILPGQAYFPMFEDEIGWSDTPGEVTFNFGASAFAGTVPSGYSAWNSAGGAAPTPGPLSPMTINVANAPAWAASTTYVAGGRVLAGPAWNGSAYTSGDALYLWALTSGAGGTSGTSAAAFNSCPNPANYGGGLLGNTPTQWLGASTASDGALTWTCLTKVDYPTFTAMAADSPVTWAVNTTYHQFDYVLNGGNSYIEAGATSTCTSATSGAGPSGTTPGADGTCTWNYMGTVPYSSEANRLPHQTTYASGSVTESNIDWNTAVNLWYGGRAAPEYLNGAGGEADPIEMANHIDFLAEYTPYCYHGDTGVDSVQVGNCAGAGVSWMITLQPAPGDGFATNMAPGVTPFGYPNPAYGVTITSDSAYTNAPPFPGTALALSDSETNVFGLQFLSREGPALISAATGSSDLGFAGNGHGNNEYLNGDIFYAGGGLGAIDGDSAFVVTNSTITYAGTTSGCFGIWAKFDGEVENDTLIGPGTGAANCTAIMTFESTALGPASIPYYNDALFGWANPWAYGTAVGKPATAASNNATDLASGYTAPAAFDLPGTNNPYQAAMLPGVSLYGLSAAAQFVSPTPGAGMDLRLLRTGSLYGGGADFSFTLAQGLNQTMTVGADIFGNGRPQGARYDIGAYEVSLGCASASGTGCN